MADLSPEWVRIGSDWVQWILGGLGAVGLVLWATLGRRDRATEHSVGAVTTRLAALEVSGARLSGANCAEHGARLARVEEALRTGPTHDHLARVHARIDGVEQTVGRIEGAAKRMEKNLDLLVAHQLEHGPRAGDHHP